MERYPTYVSINEPDDARRGERIERSEPMTSLRLVTSNAEE